MQRSTLLAGTVILLILVGLAGADERFKERRNLDLAELTESLPVEPASQASSPTSLSPATASSVMPTATTSSISSAPSVPSSSPSSSRVVKKGTSTRKQSGVNVDEIIARLGLAKQETNETSFITLATQAVPPAQTTVLLLHDDRAFLFSWIENDNVKPMFGNLKQALQQQFSGKLADLKDETITAPDGPPVNVLSFFDPALSAERVIFLRVRTRLYEIRIAKNGEGIVDQLVAELSK
ncbi:MAG: hypothetical protein PHZ00_06185 [Candidatus Peribacteraceae bacterium]|nr:hypothetical protein [Candidatus Peribacteraceae bacterium]